MRLRTSAFTAALVVVAAVAGAQDASRTARAGGDKSPTTARLIGIVPGAGHIYAGETRRGLTYMGGMAGAAMLAGLALALECYPTVSAENDCDSSGSETLVTVALLGFWGWTIYDAGEAAHRTNARRRWRLSLLAVPARVAASPSRETRGLNVGLSLRAR